MSGDHLERLYTFGSHWQSAMDDDLVSDVIAVIDGRPLRKSDLRAGVDELERLRTERVEARAALTVAAELIDRLAFDDGCDYDHHAYCQAHNLHEHPCPHPLGRQFVESWRAVEAEQQKAADDDHQ